MSKMSIKTAVDVITALMAGDDSPTVLLRGETGIGKSFLPRQIGAALGFNTKSYSEGGDLIDCRIGQMSEGDLIGLLWTDGTTSKFNPPAFFYEACKRPMILFMDEINRGTEELMQATFQVVLDREIGGHKFHPGTKIFSAINTGQKFFVRDMDPALLRRFFVIDLEPTPAEWLVWAKKENIAYFIQAFIAAHNSWLDPPKKFIPGEVTQTRHSWHRLSDSLKRANIDVTFNSPLFSPMCSGFVGEKATEAFMTFCRTINTYLSAADILDRFDDPQVSAKYRTYSIEALNGLIFTVADQINSKYTLEDLTPARSKNLGKFMASLVDENSGEPLREHRISFWSQLNKNNNEDIIKWAHPNIVDSILEVFKDNDAIDSI